MLDDWVGSGSFGLEGCEDGLPVVASGGCAEVSDEQAQDVGDGDVAGG